jgi:hypothetical protein
LNVYGKIKTAQRLWDVAFILVDEGDFFIPSQQEECRMVVEGYRLKTKPKIVMVSTPYWPGGLFQQIELDPNSPYHKLLLHYSIGVGKIYNVLILALFLKV